MRKKFDSQNRSIAYNRIVPKGEEYLFFKFVNACRSLGRFVLQSVRNTCDGILIGQKCTESRNDDATVLMYMFLMQRDEPWEEREKQIM